MSGENVRQQSKVVHRALFFIVYALYALSHTLFHANML